MVISNKRERDNNVINSILSQLVVRLKFMVSQFNPILFFYSIIFERVTQELFSEITYNYRSLGIST